MVYGLNIENGRIKDDEHIQLKAALREVCHTFHPGIRLTGHQSIMFCDLAMEARGPLEEILRKHHVPLSEKFRTPGGGRWRALPFRLRIIDYRRATGAAGHDRSTGSGAVETGPVEGSVHAPHDGLSERLRWPYNCDIGLVGKTVGKYTVFVGGRHSGRPAE